MAQKNYLLFLTFFTLICVTQSTSNIIPTNNNKFAKTKEVILREQNNWKKSFNEGNASAVANFYEDDAIMIAKPYGTFKGKQAIREFWDKLFKDGYNRVLYLSTKINQINESYMHISATWVMNKAYGIITNEFWVIQKDGGAKLRMDQFQVLGGTK